MAKSPFPESWDDLQRHGEVLEDRFGRWVLFEFAVALFAGVLTTIISFAVAWELIGVVGALIGLQLATELLGVLLGYFAFSIGVALATFIVSIVRAVLGLVDWIYDNVDQWYKWILIAMVGAIGGGAIGGILGMGIGWLLAGGTLLGGGFFGFVGSMLLGLVIGVLLGLLIGAALAVIYSLVTGDDEDEDGAADSESQGRIYYTPDYDYAIWKGGIGGTGGCVPYIWAGLDILDELLEKYGASPQSVVAFLASPQLFTLAQQYAR